MRSPQAVPAPLAFGPFVLDFAGGQLLRQGQPVKLPPRLWAVLVHLAGHAGQLVGKDELLDAVWGHRHVSESMLKVTINGLRSKLGDNPTEPLYVETVARRGYRFIAPVQALGADAAGEDGPVSPEAHAVVEAGDTTEATAAASPPAGNLPTPTVTLVGRATAVDELRSLLARHRLVTLLGPGGVGKTQLALATAGLEPPAGGVWLVRLESLSDAAALLDTVARALNLGANAGRSVDALAQALEPLSVRVVLDNAEHLVDALAPLVSRCLARAGRLQVLATSQVPLRVTGEVLMPLPALEVPPAGDVPGQAAGDDPLRFPAAALFLERVRGMQPQFEPTASEIEDIAALCRLLDGLPLALELAAARVPLLGTAGVRSRMDNRLALLSRGTRDASERHRTLRGALEWSFGLLPAGELRVLRRLSVFAGSFTPALAQAVAADPGEPEWQVLDALQNLHDHSLLVLDASTGERRMRQLESVRALAAEHLRSAGEEQATRTRLAMALRDLFRAAQARYTRTPLLHWLAPLRAEADNLRVALAHVLAALPAPGADAPPGTDAPHAPADVPARDLAVDLFSHAVLFWLRSGRKREAQRAYEALAPHARHLPGETLRAAYGLAVGALAAYGQMLPPADALPSLVLAEQAYAGLGDGRSAMLALYLHAALLQRMAPTEDRSPLLQRMRAFEQPDWSARERNFAAWTEAVNAHGHGDLATFRDFCASDLARARAEDDRAEAWVAAFGLGQALWALGEPERSRDTLTQAVDDLRACGLLREYATTAGLAASVRLAVEGGVADGVVREAADLLRAEGMLWWMGEALMTLPARRGDWPAALCLRAWMDDRMRTMGVKRSPIAASLAESFDALLAHARAKPGWSEPEVPGHEALNDAEVLRLSFG